MRIPTNDEFLTLDTERQKEALAQIIALHAENPEAAESLGYTLAEDYEITESGVVEVISLAE